MGTLVFTLFLVAGVASALDKLVRRNGTAWHVLVFATTMSVCAAILYNHAPFVVRIISGVAFLVTVFDVVYLVANADAVRRRRRGVKTLGKAI